MKISTISGHLTAHDKRVLIAIISAGGNGAKTPRKVFRVEGGTVWITENNMGWNGMQTQTNKSSFSAT